MNKENGTNVPTGRDNTYDKTEVRRKSIEELFETSFNADQKKALLGMDIGGGGGSTPSSRTEPYVGPTKVLYKGYVAGQTSSFGTSKFPCVLKKNNASVVVDSVSLNISTPGALSFGVVNRGAVVNLTSLDVDPSSIRWVDTVTFTSTGLQTHNFRTKFELKSGEYLVVGKVGETCNFITGGTGDSYNLTHAYRNSSTGKWVQSSSAAPGIEFSGHEEGTTVIETDSQGYTTTTTTVGTKETYYHNGMYSALRDSTSYTVPSKYPFFLTTTKVSYELELDTFDIVVSTPGTLHFGKAKKADIVVGAAPNLDYVTYFDSMTVNTEGYASHSFPAGFKLAPDEYFVVGKPGDELRYKYGLSTVTGDISRGYIVSGDTYTALPNNPTGICIFGHTDRQSSMVTGGAPSIYKGKSISILGDSISTFEGYIPEGNACYYPVDEVQDVNDTWWMKLINALGATLNVNNSWSGSRVTTTSSTASAGCGVRTSQLGTSPDVIIIFMGTNDFHWGVGLGTYDGTTTLPTSTTTFREAYAVMLNKILTNYPEAEVWACTIPQIECVGGTGFPEVRTDDVPLAAFNKAIIELADAFGVKIMEHAKCGITYQNLPIFNPNHVHPNPRGHSLMANNDIRQMDNCVRFRY